MPKNIIALLLTTLLLPSLAQAAKPNIVYIMSDELAYYEVSYMGHPRIQTPRIDRMVAEGLMFDGGVGTYSVQADQAARFFTIEAK